MIIRKVLVIYHRVDYDGIFSGCITENYLENKGQGVETLGWNYGDKLPDLEKLKQFANICMVDISFPPEMMVELYRTSRTTWIDHHITAINDSMSYGYEKMAGLRTTEASACELCWRYFYPNTEVPKLIQILSAYDIWNKTKFDWENTVMPIQYGLKARYGINYKKIYGDFTYLLENYEDILDDGDAVCSYLKDTWRSWVKNCSFEILVAGKYKGICMLSPQFGSSCFASVGDQYDIYVVANMKNGGQGFGVGMYKKSADVIPEFSCGEYLKQFGGGGHDGAAGSDISTEMFSRLIFEHVI